MKTNDLNFESAIQELEQILTSMSDDDISLEESIDMYAKAAI